MIIGALERFEQGAPPAVCEPRAQRAVAAIDWLRVRAKSAAAAIDALHYRVALGPLGPLDSREQSILCAIAEGDAARWDAVEEIALALEDALTRDERQACQRPGPLRSLANALDQFTETLIARGVEHALAPHRRALEQVIFAFGAALPAAYLELCEQLPISDGVRTYMARQASFDGRRIIVRHANQLCTTWGHDGSAWRLLGLYPPGRGIKGERQ